MHAFEIKVRHHCYASADSTALPVTVIVFFMGWFWANRTIGTSEVMLLSFAIRGTGAWIGAHVAALFYCLLFRGIGHLCFRHRIKTEQAQNATSATSHPHPT